MKQSGGLRPITEWTVQKPLSSMASVSYPCHRKSGCLGQCGLRPRPFGCCGNERLRGRLGAKGCIPGRTMQHLEPRCHRTRLLLRVGAACATHTSVPVQDSAEHRDLHLLRCKVQLGASAQGGRPRPPRNLKYALIQRLRSVWMGSEPIQTSLRTRLASASGSTPYCAQRPNREQPQVAGARTRGRLLCSEPITRTSDHAQKLAVRPQLQAALCGLPHCDDRCVAWRQRLCRLRAVLVAQSISAPDAASDDNYAQSACNKGSAV